MNRFFDKILIHCLSIIAMLNTMHGNYLILTICLSVALSGAELYLLSDEDYKDIFKYDSILDYIGVILDIVAILICLSDIRLIIIIPVIIYDVVCSRNIVGLLLSIIVYVTLAYQIISDGDISKMIILYVGLVTIISFYLAANTKKINKLSRKCIELRDDTHIKQEQLAKQNAKLVVARDEQIHSAQLAERNRIAREIHDNVGHMLSRAILQMGALLSIYKEEPLHEQLEGVRETLDGAMNNIRSSVHDLHDESIDVKSQIETMAKPLNEKFKVDLDLDIDENMNRQIKYVIIGVCKEAISNIMKYSVNSNVDIKLIWHPSMYQLVIYDYYQMPDDESGKKVRNNSSGDNALSSYISNSSGMGLEGIRNRVESVDGLVRIMDDDGFKVFVTIPIK